MRLSHHPQNSIAMWHYVHDSQTIGPVTEEQLLGLIRSGQIRPQTLLWTEGMASWLPANQTGFAAHFPATGLRVHAPAAATVAPVAPTYVAQPAQPVKKKGNPAVLGVAGAVGGVIGYLAVRSLPSQLTIRLFAGAVAGTLRGLIPYFIGRARCPKLAKTALWSCTICGMILGALLALPVAIVFSIVLAVKSPEQT